MSTATATRRQPRTLARRLGRPRYLVTRTHQYCASESPTTVYARRPMTLSEVLAELADDLTPVLDHRRWITPRSAADLTGREVLESDVRYEQEAFGMDAIPYREWLEIADPGGGPVRPRELFRLLVLAGAVLL